MKEFKFKVLQEGLTYEQALYELEENGVIITRPEWKGYHFRYFNNYGIRLKSGEVMFNPDEVYDTDKNDWMVIDIDEQEGLDTYEKIKEVEDTLI